MSNKDKALLGLILKVEMLEHNLAFLMKCLEGEGSLPEGAASRLTEACWKSNFNAIIEKYNIPPEETQFFKTMMSSMHEKIEIIEECDPHNT